MKTIPENLEALGKFVKGNNPQISQDEALRALKEIETRLVWMGVK